MKGVPTQKSSTTTDMKSEKVALEDDEYAWLMSKLDELEKEELEAENNCKSSEQEVIEAVYDPIPKQKSRFTKKVSFRVAKLFTNRFRCLFFLVYHNYKEIQAYWIFFPGHVLNLHLI